MLDRNLIPKLARSSALRYFAEVAERGSFRSASEALHIAASAINRQVSNLEEDLGVKLFERSRGRAGLRLTDAGRILQFRLRSAINELRIAGDEIVALQGLQRGHSTLGANDGLTCSLISRAVSSFHRLYPNISYLIKIDNTRGLVSRLREGSIDFAVGYNFPADADIEIIGQIYLKMFLITSIENSMKIGNRIKIKDMGNLNLIVPDNSLLLRQTIDTTLRRSGVQVNMIVETNSFDLIYSLVGDGVGFSIVTGRREDVEDRGRIRYIEIDDDALSYNVLSCCKLRGRNTSAATRAFALHICNILKDRTVRDAS